MLTKGKIVFSVLQVTTLVLVIKFLGFIKQAVLAAYCGATLETDAFFIATGAMVNFSVILFSALSVSLLTIYTQVLVKEGISKADQLISSVLRIFLPIAIGLVLLFYFGSDVVAKILAPTYEGEKLHLLSEYVSNMSLAFFLWAYFLVINVMLEANKKFLPGKMQAFFQNIFLILGAVFLYPRYGMKILVYAFLLSGLIQCILLTWCIRRELWGILTCDFSSCYIKRLLEVALPVLLGNAIYEINSIVDGQISTSLDAGMASILNYGATIHDMVVGVIVTSISTVLFSNFSTWIARNEISHVESSLQHSLEMVTLILFPITIICIVAGDQIVTFFYGRGHFGESAIQNTYGVVICYSLGFIFQAARANLVKVYYAFQNSRKPMINGLIAVIFNIVFSLILSRVLGVAGIALATSLAMCIVTILLLRGINRYLPHFDIHNSFKEILKGIVAAILSMVVVYSLRMTVSFSNITMLVIESSCVFILYGFLLYLFKANSIKSLKFLVVTQFRKG